MAKAELQFEQVYYLEREAEGPDAYESLRHSADAADKKTREACHIPLAGNSGALPPAASACYVEETEAEAKQLSEAYGPAYNEGRRSLADQLRIQQRLIDDHILASPAADGVYGDSTRAAIISWQRTEGYLATGFLSDVQVAELLHDPSPVLVPDWKAINSLQRLFSPDMLNITIPFLESILGPARRTTSLPGGREKHLYWVSGCSVSAYTRGGAVYGYGVTISRACSVDIASFTGQAGGQMVDRSSTFGALAGQTGGGVYGATCLEGCGNASDPMIVWRYEGPHALNYIDIELQKSIAYSPSLDATEKWEAAMTPMGDTWIETGKYNCAGAERFQGEADSVFANLNPTWLFVGYGQDENQDTIDADCAPDR